MGLNVYTNTASIVAQSNLVASNNATYKSIERLSSGLRINHAADDASGLTVSERLRSQITGMARATYNAQDAISFLQTAEGGMEVIAEMVQRMRELAVQAGNGTYTANDRRELELEVDQLKLEINRIATATEYNTQKVLSGLGSGLWSSTSKDINVIMRGTPAEGNYKLDFEVNPGQNAVYKTNILVDEFPEPKRAIVYPPIVSVARTEHVPDNSVIPIIPELSFDTNSANSGITNMEFIDDGMYSTTAIFDYYANKMEKNGPLATVHEWSGTSASGYSNNGVSSLTSAYGYISNADGTVTTFVNPDRNSGRVYDVGADFYLTNPTEVPFYGTVTVVKNDSTGLYEVTLFSPYEDAIYDQVTTNDLANIPNFSGSGAHLSFGAKHQSTIDAIDAGGAYVWHYASTGGGNPAGVNRIALSYSGPMSELNPQGDDGYVEAVATSTEGGKQIFRAVEAIEGKIVRLKIAMDGTMTEANMAQGSLQEGIAAFIYGTVTEPVGGPGFDLTVVEQDNRDDLSDIDAGDTAVGAGVVNTQANGAIDSLYDTTIGFSDTISDADKNTATLLGKYSTATASAGYLNILDSSVISKVRSSNSGYLEVEFIGDMTAATDEQVKAKFIFVDAVTGDRREIDTSAISDFKIGTPHVLDFNNGTYIEFTFPTNATNSQIAAGDKLLFGITGKPSFPETQINTVEIVENAAGTSPAEAYVRNLRADVITNFNIDSTTPYEVSVSVRGIESPVIAGSPVRIYNAWLVDAVTGARYYQVPDTPNYIDAKAGEPFTIDFGNGRTVEMVLPVDPVNNVIPTGISRRVTFRIFSPPYDASNDIYATVSSGEADKGDLAVYLPGGKVAGSQSTVTTVTLAPDGKFTEANIAWEAGEAGLVSGGELRFLPPEPVSSVDELLNKIKLKDLPAFTNADNRMVLDNTQTIAIFGNDRQSFITLEGGDSISDLADKFAKAIGIDLNMGMDGLDLSNYAKLITSTGTGNYAVAGTIVFQGAAIGKQSNIKFAGDEAVMNALGITQIQLAKENEVTVTVRDAHLGILIGRDTVTDQMLRGVIGGIDLLIDSRVGLEASFDSAIGTMTFLTDNIVSEYVHIVDKKTNVQVGANECEVVNISVERFDTYALEINDAYVMTMDDSQKAITKFDQALERINHARASLGAQINRFENTLKNLAIGGQNLTAANSRIKDLDVAEESALFTKNQVLANAAIAMIAQANQMPQTALQLIRG